MKTGLLFSGQGAQQVGMGQTLYDAYSTARDFFRRADEILGYRLSSLCFDGPEEKLRETRNCQPALFVHGMAAYSALREHCSQNESDREFGAMMGLSLGELTSLTAGGAFDFETGLRTVAARADFMQKACEESEGAMASLIGGTLEEVHELCKICELEVANMNCPGQIVVSGPKDNIDRAVEKGGEWNFKRVVPLNVAGAYHSRLMEPARKEFERFLSELPIHSPQCPVYSNVTARAEYDPEVIRNNLASQVVSPVRWEECFRAAIDAGVTEFYECGPGNVCAGLAKRIDRSATVYPAGQAEDLS